MNHARPLRICLVASSRFPVRQPFMGGLEAHTHALASELRRRGHAVSLFAGPGSDPALDVVVLPVEHYEPSGQARLDVGALPTRWMQEHHAYLDLMLGIARGRHGPFDVVHDNSIHHLPVALSPLLPVPVVTTLHTPPVPWLESAVLLADGNAHFVAVSESMAGLWGARVRTRVVRNGVDTDFWAMGPGGGSAVWSGRVVPEKVPHEALRAAHLAGVPLMVAGPCHDTTYFDAAVRPLLDDARTYVGHLEAPALRDLLRDASVALVTPAWDEPFGLVAAEAMSCGTPVVAYRRGALPELVGEDGGTVVDAGDVEALALGLASAVEHDRVAVRARAVALFSLRRMVEEYERLSREVAPAA